VIENQLPTGWTLTTLEHVANWGSGGTPSRKNPNFFIGNIPWIKTGELVNKYVRDSDEKISDEAIQKSSAKVFPAGSVGIAMYGATIGKLSIFAVDASTNQACAVAVPLEEHLSNEFLYYYLLSERRALIDSGKGGAQPNISQGLLKGWPILLPPLNEQKRIVAKIEELFSELDTGIASLKTAREQLKVYRQAVLKHAFEGKLTAKWREENADKLESPEQLLERIQQEREARYQQQLEEWNDAVKAWEANGKEGKKPGKPSKLSDAKPVLIADYETPSQWMVSELGSIAYESVLGKMLDKQKNIGEERPYLGNINVRWGSFEIDQLKTMKIEETEIGRYSLVNGDLVICEGGEPGRCAVWTDDNSVIFIQKALHRVRFTESYMPKFAYYYLTYSVPLERVVKHFTGTTIKHLTGAGLSKVQLPVCSSEEQREIISIIESKISEIDALDSELYVQLKKAEILRQSILKKAFSGQLVSQDPNDEPASELLARIQAEKAEQQVAAKVKSTGKSGTKRGRKSKAAT